MDNKEQLHKIADSIGMEVDDKLIDEVLDDNQIDNISSVISNSRTDADKLYAGLPSVSGNEITEKQTEVLNESKKHFDATDMEAVIEHDPITGKSHLTVVEEAKELPNAPSIEDIADGKDVLSQRVLPESAKESILSMDIGFDDASADELLKMLNLFKENGEQKDVFNILPQTIKDMIIRQVPIGERTPLALEFFAKSFIDHIKAEIKLDSDYIEFQDSIKKEMDIPNYIDLYNENIREVMEEQMLEKADIIEPKNKEHADRLRLVSKYFTYSHSYGLMIKRIENYKSNGGDISTKLGSRLSKFNKLCNKFNRGYASSKFNIRDIREVAPILDRILPDDISMDNIKRFIILFVDTTKGMQPIDSRIHQHTYMYYFINNIVMLDHIDELKTDFSKDIVINIKKVIKLITD